MTPPGENPFPRRLFRKRPRCSWSFAETRAKAAGKSPTLRDASEKVLQRERTKEVVLYLLNAVA